MREIIQFVDIEIIQSWVKEVVADIYTQEKKVEQKSGFFGGIKSYFYKEAIDNIKYDETVLHNIKSDKIIFNIFLKISACGLTISDKKIKNNLLTNNSSKFTIKEINSSILSISDSREAADKSSSSSALSIDLKVNEFKMSAVTKLNESIY